MVKFAKPWIPSDLWPTRDGCHLDRTILMMRGGFFEIDMILSCFQWVIVRVRRWV